MLLSQIREHKSIFLLLVCFLVFTMEARAISNIDYFEFINDLKSFSASFKQYTYSENGSLIKDLEKNEKLDKNLLRFLTVKVKKFDLETNYFSKMEKINEK